MNILLVALISILVICTVLFVAIIAIAWKKHKNPVSVVDDFIQVVSERRAMPKDYLDTFENNPSGRRVLEQLITLFDQNAFVKGGIEAERETTFKLGQKSIIEFIVYAIAEAKKPKKQEAKEDE